MESADIGVESLGEALQPWVGRAQTEEDVAAAGPLARLASLLDHEAPPWIAGELPPLAHWLYFLPSVRQSLLDIDGHAKRGDMLPPVPLPQRMWAGSRVRFLQPIPVGSTMSRRSTIAGVTAKSGRSGPMIFITVEHRITVGGSVAVIEEQDLVYRGPVSPSTAAASADGAQRAATLRADALPPRAAASPSTGAAPELRSRTTRRFVPDPVRLFRFSALTFNAHRIHYDRDYARDVEGYPGLVVHGQLLAILLLDHFLRHAGAVQVNAFAFRAQQPLFDTAPFDLCLGESDGGATLWASAANGTRAFTASLESRQR